MCGIIGFFNFGIIDKKTKKKIKPEPTNKEVIDQLQDQISRGNEGFGILMIDKKNEIELKRATEITKALLDLYMTESSMIMMHHRNPTSSDNRLSQTHPIVVSNELLEHDYYVVHNGIISNTDDLKEEHEKLGFIYNTVRKSNFNREEYNDSESLAIEIAMYIEKQTKEISTEGSAAFMVVQIDKKTKKATNIFFGRKDNPLKLSGRQGEIRLSSEGKGENIIEKTLYKFSIKSPSLTKTSLIFKKEEKTNYNYNKSFYHNNNEANMGTRKQIESGSGSGYNIKTKETKEIEEEETTEDKLESISDEFITSTTEIIEQFATNLGDLDKITKIDIDSEKRALAVDINTNIQKSYNLAIDIAQEHIYDSIEKETKEKIEREEEKEEKEKTKEETREKTLIGFNNHEDDYNDERYQT